MIAINKWAENAYIDYQTKRNGRPVPVLLEGKPGIAKSEFVERQLPGVLSDRLFPGEDNDTPADQRPIGNHINWSASGLVATITDIPAMRDAPDYKGFLVPRKDGTSAYTKPDLVVEVERVYAAGARVVILFLDEVGQADHLTQKALADVQLNGRLGSFSLPPETWVVMATNRTNDHAGVNRMLSINRNRINTMPVYLPVESWVRYATDVLGLPGLAVSFAKAFPGKVSIEQPPKDGAFSSWRSYTDAALWMKAYKQAMGFNDDMSLPLGGKGNEYAQEKVAGFIGEGAAVELAAYAQVVNELPTKEEMEQDPMDAKLPSRERMDASYAAAQMVTQYADASNIDAMWQYAERLPKEMQTSIARDLLAPGRPGGGTLLNSQRLSKWIAGNQALIRASL